MPWKNGIHIFSSYSKEPNWHIVLGLAQIGLISTSRIAGPTQPMGYAIPYWHNVQYIWGSVGCVCVYVGVCMTSAEVIQFKNCRELWNSVVASVSSALCITCFIIIVITTIFSLFLCWSSKLHILTHMALLLPFFSSPHPGGSKGWASGCIMQSCQLGSNHDTHMGEGYQAVSHDGMCI